MTRLFPLIFCLCLFSPAYVLAQCDAEVAFSPHGKSLDLIVSAIKSAKQTIRVTAYSFTSKPISQALVAAHRHGVDVKVVADAKTNNGYTSVTYLAHQGIPVRLNDRYAIMHSKFMVVDGKTVQTGSFNYTGAAANNNAENVLVVKDCHELASHYVEEWHQLWEEGEALKKGY